MKILQTVSAAMKGIHRSSTIWAVEEQYENHQHHVASTSTQREAKDRQGICVELEIQKIQNYQQILPKEGKQSGKTALNVRDLAHFTFWGQDQRILEPSGCFELLELTRAPFQNKGLHRVENTENRI